MSLTRQPQPTTISIPKSIFTSSSSSSSSTLPTSSQEAAANHVSELNAFFPFDPYHLPLSRSYIDAVYREWDEVKIDDGDGDEDETDEEEGDSTSEGADVRDSSSSSSSSPSSSSPDDKDKGKSLAIPISMRARARPMGISPAVDDSDDALGLGGSFGGMSISPGRRMSGAGAAQPVLRSQLAAGV